MSWHYSQEQEADFSLVTYLDGLRSARSKSSSTPAKSSCSDNGTGCSSSSQSGTMCEPSTVARGVESLMLFRGDFPAKTSALRVQAMDLTETVRACGSSMSESLKKYGLRMSLPKTHRLCVPVDSAPSSKDLPSWGMTHDGVCWELGISARRTSGIGFGYSLPTPTASEGGRNKSLGPNAKIRPSLGMMARKNLWPTPTVSGNYNRKGASKSSGDGLATAVRKWETPTTQDAKNNGAPSQHKRNSKPLNAEVGGALNPPWVEWLMGWPLEWTDLKPLETDRFQQWRRQHLKS